MHLKSYNSLKKKGRVFFSVVLNFNTQNDNFSFSSFEVEILNSDFQRQYEENLKEVEKYKEDTKKVK